jgi:hypothetical protein
MLRVKGEDEITPPPASGIGDANMTMTQAQRDYRRFVNQAASYRKRAAFHRAQAAKHAPGTSWHTTSSRLAAPGKRPHAPSQPKGTGSAPASSPSPESSSTPSTSHHRDAARSAPSALVPHRKWTPSAART